jgi:site-specific recombinase XerD
MELDRLSVKDVQAFVLRHARNRSPKSIQLMLTALRSFLQFLYLRGLITISLAEQVPSVVSWRQTEPPKWLPDADIQRLLNSCDRHSAIGQRNYAILLLLARLGLRAGEILSLELDDIRWDAAEIEVRGKGSQRKRFPLTEDVGSAIAAYLKNARPSCGSRRLFLRTRAPYRGLGHASSVDTIVSRSLARAGLDPPMKGAHLLRHSLATHMLRNGATLTEIGQILHHANPDTTSIYAKVDIEGLRDLAQSWPGDCS